VGDALVAVTDAWGRIATDVATLGRPEIGELAEPDVAGRGGSSTMPQKQNPVLSVLVRRAALTAPGLGATLHTAAAIAVDERPDGSWHAEWGTLRNLARQTVVAGSQTTELVSGLRVDTRRMAETVATARDVLMAERRSVGGDDADGRPEDYLGVTDRFVDLALTRARAYLEGAS
jgi:3-carboxy-cis,cis-muconate cycloisomerase